MAQADHDWLQSDLGVARIQVARGQAMLAALDSGRILKLARPNGVDDVKVAEAQRLLAGQIAEVNAKQGRIEAETAKREAELRSTHEFRAQAGTDRADCQATRGGLPGMATLSANRPASSRKPTWLICAGDSRKSKQGSGKRVAS